MSDTMSDMGNGQHEVPERHKTHLWVLILIAVPAAIEVFACWVGLGSLTGFPPVLGHGTGWTLAIGMEAYGGYAMWAWLSGAPGERSRKFAMGSAIAAFTLSLGGQVAYHLMLAYKLHSAPVTVVVFVACLLVVVLGFAAALIHLMHADARAAEDARARTLRAQQEAAQLRAESDERAALRAQIADMGVQLADAHDAREAAQRVADLRAEAERERDAARAAQEDALRARDAADEARTEAEQRAAKAEADNARLARKLASAAPAKGAGRGRREAATTVPSDVDARAEALALYLSNPDISGASLGTDVGMSKRWGQDRKKEFESRTAEGGNRSTENSATD